MQAGRIEFEGTRGEPKVTWAQLANTNQTDMVEEGSIVQLGEGGAWEQRVGSSDTISVYYNKSGNRTQISSWNGA